MSLAALCALFAPLRAEDAEIRDAAGGVLRLIPAGRFERGANDLAPGFHKDHADFNIEDERPVHPVVLTQPFYLGATEVTVGQFRKFVAETSYVTTAEKNQLGIVGWDPTPPKDNPRFVATFRQRPEFTWKNPGFAQTDEHPVVGVSQADARAYCAWLSQKDKATYRLPTEAEWEYAARAGTETWFSFGDAYRHTIHRCANVGNVELELAFPDRVRRQWLVDVARDPPDRHVFTAPVGSYEPNPWQLHDLAGNVWEWCEDLYLDTAYAPFTREGYQQVRKRAIDPVNTTKWNEHGDWRIIRGGSWFNAPIQCRSAARSYFEAQDAACYLGFRVARDASPAAIAEAKQAFARSEAARAEIEKLAGPYRENRDGRLTLRLRREQITPELAAQLQQLDDPLDLHADGQYKLTADDVALLLQTAQLRGLLLSNVGMMLQDADLAGLAGHPNLEQLQVSETPAATDALFTHLAGLKKLEFLSLQGEGITDDGLARLPELPRLRSLFLNNTKSTGAVLAKLAGAPLDNVSFSNFTDEHAALLAGFPRLQALRLSGSPITGQTTAELGRLARLTSLDIDRCAELRDADFAPLAGCLLLQRLNAEKSALGDEAATALAGLNNLGDLRCGSPALTDVGARRLCELVSLRGLAISADATSLTDAGLSDLWRLQNLQSLELNAPGLTGTGLASLHELPELRSLSIGSPALNDAGLREVVRSKTLQQLTCGGYQSGGPTGLTDAGLEHVAQAEGLKTFTLFRKNCPVTEAGLDKLRAAKPGLNVSVR